MILRSMALIAGCTAGMLFGSNVPGENLWRLTNSVYLIVSEIDAEIDLLNPSSFEILATQIEDLVSSLDIANSLSGQIVSDIDTISSQLESLIDSISMLENLDTIIIEGTCSCVDKAQQSLSIFDTILKSDIDSVSTKVDSVGTQVSGVASTVNATATIVNTLQTCLVGTAITQSMMPYTISSPGNYYLCESVSTSGAPAITISASNVYLDLNGHTITNTNNSGISCSNRSNIYITNGTIIPSTQGLILSTCNMVTVTDIVVLNATTYAIQVTDVTNFLVDQCVLAGTTMSASTLNGAMNLLRVGPGTVKNVSVRNANKTGGCGFSLFQTPNTTFELINCAVSEARVGFYFEQFVSNTPTTVVRDCVASNTSLAGFYSDSGGSTYDGPVFDNCVSQISTYGFLFISSLNTVFRNCVSTLNQNGFYIVDATNFVFEGCIANNNTADGFSIANTGATGSVGTTFDHCLASKNVTGFRLSGTAFGSNSAILNRCVATGNSGSGINNAGASTYIVDCRSYNASATTLNPAYNLNGAPDVLGTATVIITS